MNQHHFLTTYIWNALNMNANQMKSLLREKEKCLNHVFLLEKLKNYQDGKNLSYDMERHAQKRVERNCELANKMTVQLYKVSTLCQIRKEELESVGELSEVCSQIVLNYLYLARIGRLDILWSVNKFARSVTKWTQAFDRRWARLTSYIHHTSDYRQFCHVGNTAQHCRLGSFQDSDFAGDLEDSKSTSGETFCKFGSHTFVPYELDV